jgi:hypothetical protein
MIELACGDFQDVLTNENFIPISAIALGSVVGVVGIIGGTVGGIVRARTREQTRREIAAYVAEGSIDPDKAVEILNAGLSRHDIRRARDHFGRA